MYLLYAVLATDMEFAALFTGMLWCFQPGARFTIAARRRMKTEAARILARVRVRRVRAGYRPDRSEYLHRACCDVGELIAEVERWEVQWPAALAVIRASAEGAWLHPAATEFTHVPNMTKLLAGSFITEQLIGEGLARLEAFRDHGEWIPVDEALALLFPIE
jgi:hypothetical protein